MVQNAINTVFGLGFALVFVATLLINHFDLFGLRQVTLYLARKPYRYLEFRTPLFYRYMRHRLYVGWLIAFWAAYDDRRAPSVCGAYVRVHADGDPLGRAGPGHSSRVEVSGLSKARAEVDPIACAVSRPGGEDGAGAQFSGIIAAKRKIPDKNRDILDAAAELFRQRIQGFFSNVDEVFALHRSPQRTKQGARSFRVAFVCVFIFIIFFAVAFVFLFVFFLVGLLSKKDIGSQRAIRGV